jgi:hypothetical protein
MISRLSRLIASIVVTLGLMASASADPVSQTTIPKVLWGHWIITKVYIPGYGPPEGFSVLRKDYLGMPMVITAHRLSAIPPNYQKTGAIPFFLSDIIHVQVSRQSLRQATFWYGDHPNDFFQSMNIEKREERDLLDPLFTRYKIFFRSSYEYAMADLNISSNEKRQHVSIHGNFYFYYVNKNEFLIPTNDFNGMLWVLTRSNNPTS